MATFVLVLVHGAWSGAHGFRHVRTLLQARGHAVFTPSLTGLGERVHLVSPLVDLSTHVRDVVNAVRYEDLHDIVLLGHSYGGAVVTGCVDHIGERIRHLVFLDAFVPRDGESVAEIWGLDLGARDSIGDPWLVPPADRTFDDPDEAAFAVPRRNPHPIGCFTEPVALARPLAEHPFGLTYIRATAEPRGGAGDAVFGAAASAVAADDRWRYAEIATGHMVMHSAPGELAELLLAMA